MSLSEEELEVLWVGAFRFYLGRKSPDVADFCEMLVENWSQFPYRLKLHVALPLIRAFELDSRQRREAPTGNAQDFALGEQCDRLSWERVRQLVDKEFGNPEAPHIQNCVSFENRAKG